ncbi:MAG: hypothetical protein K8H88_28145, partial [Sandaracinaceae bacterium]|nr:hypothetical protein [Sandaracinaceae bacterium]
LEEDTTTATGFRVAIPEAAMPANRRGRPVDPAQFRRFDGFSPMPAIVTSYPGVVDASGLNDENEIAASLEADNSTLILDYETGERVPHWGELDEWEGMGVDPARKALYLRPAVRLREGARYVVAIRNLDYMGGAPIEPSDYFRALRDSTPLAGASDIEGRRAHFEEIFTALGTAGVARGELIEAWDFVTATGETIWGDLVAMRDDALGADGAEVASRVGARGLGCNALTVQDDVSDNIWRRVQGTLTVPLYLEGEGAVARDAAIHRDAQGRPALNGMAEVPFIVQIPRSLYDRVRAGGEPGRLEVYGHGLFGDRLEVQSGWHQDHQNRLGLVSAAVDWWGMSSPDVPRITLTLQEFSDFYLTGERLSQAVINVLVLARSMLGVCADLPQMQIPLEAGGTAPAYDTGAAYYYGNSQGGIMGGVVAGVSTDIERFALGVGGMSYPLMIKRSVNWNTYGLVMANGYRDALTRDVIMAMSASLWDISEPSTYSPHLVTDPLPGTPPHRILMQIGVGDAQVPNLSAHLQARTIGIPYLTPSPQAPFGLTGVDATMTEVENALVVYQIPGAEPAPPGTRAPPGDNEAHEGVRRSTAAMDQMDAFFRPDGMVTQTCDGICDPT